MCGPGSSSSAGRCSGSAVQPAVASRHKAWCRVEPRAVLTEPAEPGHDTGRATQLRDSLERTDRMACAQPHRQIDIGPLRDMLAERAVRLVDDGEHDAVDDLGVVDRARWVRRDVELRRRPDRAAPVLVAVEPETRLSTEMAGRDQPFLDRRRPEAFRERVASRDRSGVDAAGGGEVDVDADEVHELERSHREAGGADGRIDGQDRRSGLPRRSRAPRA